MTKPTELQIYCLRAAAENRLRYRGYGDSQDIWEERPKWANDQGDSRSWHWVPASLRSFQVCLTKGWIEPGQPLHQRWVSYRLTSKGRTALLLEAVED